MVFKSRSEIGVETKQWLLAQLFSKFAQILVQVWRVELKRSICYSHSIHQMCLNTHASLASQILFFNFEALWQVWQMLK